MATNYMNANLEHFLDSSRRARTVAELTSRYAEICEGYGYDRFGHALINEQVIGNSVPQPTVVQIQGLEEWAALYMHKQFYAIDPVAMMSVSNPGVFSWKKLIQSATLSAAQQAIFSEAESAGLFSGFTVSVHGPQSRKATTVLASTQKSLMSDPNTHDVLNLATYQFHLCYTKLTELATPGKDKLRLSIKEQEVLKWAAQGYTKYEIGARMNTSAHTVDYHVRKLLTKLDAKNTCAAVVTAIQEGLI